MILDFYDDGGALLEEFAGEELAKVASAGMSSAVSVDKKDRVCFPDEEFALLKRASKGDDPDRFFSISDLPNTLTSMFYFMRTGDQLPPKVRAGVENRLTGALKEHGLEFDTEEDLSKAASVEDFDEPTRRERVAHENFIEVREQKIGFTTPEQLEKVASSVSGQIGALSPIERRDIALQLHMYGAEIPEPLAKYAAVDENPSRGYYIERRRKFAQTHRPDAVRTLEQIVAVEDLEKQAALLSRWDEEVSVRRIPDAFQTVFAKAERRERDIVPEEKLEKVASIMGGEVRELVKQGRLGQLTDEHKRVLSVIMEG